jgi:hypothetical protein
LVLKGTIALLPDGNSAVAASKEVSCSSASTFDLSGPWHLKHLSDRMGFICLLKSIFFE